MNLKVVQTSKLADAKAVTGVGWFNGSDFIATTEDKLVQRFNLNNTLQSEFDPKVITELPTYPMCMEWCVVQHGVTPDIFAVGMSDGSLIIVNASGRIEKTVPGAHTGAVTSISWNRDGSALATGGEDGVVRLWSPQANLRARLTQLSAPVLALTWDSSGQFVVCAHGNQLVRKSVTPDTKDLIFTGHTGVVLCVTYSPVLGVYLSGAEDNTYRLWDKHGRCVFVSEPIDLPITSVAFSPLGTSFACGTYDCLLLCDRQGWVSDRLLLTPNTTTNTTTNASTASGLGVGSLYSIAYSPDGAALAIGSAAGHVIVASIFNLRAECDGWVCYSGASNNVYVGQIDRDEEDTLDVNGRVTSVTLGHGHLIVTTPSSATIYPLSSLSSPHTLEATLPSAVKLSSNQFAFVDNTIGIRVYGYTGKLLSAFKFPGFSSELLTPMLFDVSTDVTVAVSTSSPTKIMLYDTNTGKPVTSIQHNLSVTSVTLSPGESVSGRLIAYVDSSKDLHLCQVSSTVVSNNNTPPTPVLLMSQASGALFHSTHPALMVSTDSRLVVYWYPNAYFIDPAIAAHTSTKIDLPSILARGAIILPSFGFRAEMLAADGSYHTFPLSMLASTLLQTCRSQQWRQAMSLARSHSDTLLWALLAAMALSMQQVDVAELALAELDEVDKVEYMRYIRSLPSASARAAELLLYSHRPDDAQRLLMQAGLTYRAIKLCIRTFRWERALSLAVQTQQHVDTVLYHRQLYLSTSKSSENNVKFIEIAQQVNVDSQAVIAKEQQEQEQELTSGGKYQGFFLSAE